MCNLGNSYSNGNGVDQNYTEAVKWYQKAIDGGNAYGMSGLAYCYELGYGVKQDYAEALKWYEKALENGREKDEWITERIENCKSRLAGPTAIIEKIWVDKNEQSVSSVNIHCRFVINNLKGSFANIKVILEMNKRKIKKSFEFANKENIKYVIVVGEDEVAKRKYSLKNMETGNQELLSCDEIINIIKKNS